MKLFSRWFRPKTQDEAGYSTILINYPGASGTPLTEDGALKISTVFACVRLLSETVGTLPCMIYRNDGDKPTVDKNHPLYSLLHDSPNYDFTAVEYFERMMADLCLFGNHYSETTRSASGKPVALTGLDPHLVRVWRDWRDGRVRYQVYESSGVREIPQENMFHVRGFGTTADDVEGLSIIQYATNSLGIASSTENITAKTYENGLRPSGVLSTELILKPEQRQAARDWAQKMAGTASTGSGLLVLEGGYKYQPVSISPVDAQLLQNRAFSVEDICRWFRVPPHMVGHTEKSTSWGSGLEQQGIAFATYTLRPYLTRIERAIKKWLIPRAEQGSVYAEFNLEGLLRADSAARASFYSMALQNGWMNRNEVRQKENYGPIPGGEVYTAQTSLAPLDMLGTIKDDNGTGTQTIPA